MADISFPLIDDDSNNVSSKLMSKVPMTETLCSLLEPNLHRKEPIFTRPLTLPNEGEKVYNLTEKQIHKIKSRRGQVVDLHPGGGYSS